MCIYAVTVLFSVISLAAGISLESPPLVSASAVSVFISVLYTIEAFLGRNIRIVFPLFHIVALAVSLALAYGVDTECYPGFRLCVIPYPVLGFCAVISLIAFFNLKFYRELIATFIFLFGLAISSFTGVVIYMLYHSEFDITVNNALNTQEFAAAFVWCIVFAVAFMVYEKMKGLPRFFDSERVLEAGE